jgi:LmbE family N-acetylglucosaminyl deacetylase
MNGQTSPDAQAALSILAIGAHPDDVELGCGGSLAHYTKLGAKVSVLIFSHGRRGAMSHEDRAAESTHAFAKIGVTDVVVLDFPDTGLGTMHCELVRAIEDQVNSRQPTRVYTMFEHDRHQDHRAIYHASTVACRRVPQLLCYETPSSYPNFVPMVFQGIEDHLEAKVAALKCHKSQGERFYMQEEKIRAAAHFRGAQVEQGPCEGFIPYRMML